ncbi:MAG: MATE family efflux transporter [Clostridia bacterium]|nr:MATE family efflux transporter [Clostridia bacterium]
MTALKTKRKNEINMTEGALLGKLLLFTLPIIGSNVLQALFNTVDMIVVGKFEGDIALGAVGTTGSLISLITSIFVGLSLGAGVCVSVALGARKERDVSEFVHTGIALALVSGVLVGVVGALLAPVFLSWMNVEGALLEMATAYVRVYFIGAPFITLYNFGFAIMRSLGDTRRPLLYIIVAGVANAGFNLFFVAVCGIGVVGVALGTVVSYLISSTCVVVSLCRYQNACRLSLRRLHLSLRHLAEICRIGIPAGVRGALFGISNTMLQASVNSLGDIATAGNAAGANIENYLYFSVSAYSATAAAFIGQNYGAGKHRRIRRVLGICLLLTALTGMAVGWGFLLGRHALLSLYLDVGSPAMEIGAARMISTFTLYFLEGVYETLGGALQGIKVTFLPTVATILCICVFRLLWIFTVFPLPSMHTIGGLYLCYPISWALNILFLLGMILYYYPRLCPREPLPTAE